ncbi:MMPL family transporter [Patulibacter minatonensis]|uniref:MMPL family transporter n=1 Tax=Patulibacter minatonensis TaxID=298163 RepID=UPI0004B572DD|nr:MMPL family transporter [Patulibacter minatonensis]
MSSLLARYSRSLIHHWKRTLGVAFLVLVLLGVASGVAGGPSADNNKIPGAESQKAIDLFQAHGQANLAGADADVVFQAKSGKLTDPKARADIEKTLAAVRKVDHVAKADSPFAKGGLVSKDGTIAQAKVQYDVEAIKLDKKDGTKLEDALKTVKDPAVQISSRGQVVDLAAEESFPVGELAGVAIAMVLLTVLFGSKAAMGATLLGAVAGVIFGQVLIAALAKPLGLPSFASQIALMLGLGAGIDYALLIVGRYREQLAAGDSKRDAAAKAAATSGASVVAAGAIVIVAILGLYATGIPLIGAMGLGTALGVLAVVLAALFVLPGMLGAWGEKLRPRKIEHVQPSPFFARWGERITRRPWLSIGAGVVILLVFAAPLTQMRLGQPDDGNKGADKTQRIAYDAQAKAFGKGSNGTFLLAVDIGNKNDPALKDQLAKIASDVKKTPGVASASPAVTSPDGEIATIGAVPTTAPQDQKTSDLLSTLRDDVLPQATKGTELKVYVGGQTAGFEDFSDKVASRIPLFIALVIGLSVILLIAAFRSLWIPLVSAVFNLLSVGAAYGAVVAVFQQGFGSSLIGVENGVPIISFLPVMLFAILFGLSMDYNVFLLSRIQEAHHEGEKPRQAVIIGLSRIGKVILVAGLVMASVFLFFATADDVIAKMFGVGLGVAILVDVLIVRLVVAPAVVLLLGEKAWWLPKWLDRILPNVSLEGHLVKNEDPKGEPLQGFEAPQPQREHAVAAGD